MRSSRADAMAMKCGAVEKGTRKWEAILFIVIGSLSMSWDIEMCVIESLPSCAHKNPQILSQWSNCDCESIHSLQC